jgi:hypothetical protein
VELFGKAKGTISEHIKHIFEDESWMRKQLFGHSEQLLWMGNNTMSLTTTWTW